MTALDVITWVLLAAAVTLNIVIWVRQRRLNRLLATRPSCPGHKYGEQIHINGDTPDSGMSLTVSTSPTGTPVLDTLDINWPALGKEKP